MTSRLDRLTGKSGVLVCDGAMGTMLYGRGVFINRSFEELNLSRPELVREVHQEYRDAGADVIETNTFGANRFKLAPHGLENLVAQINSEGVRLAREVAGDEALVAGGVGPLGVRIEPWGSVSVEEARAAFREQITALLDGGVDLLILETFSHLPELREAVAAVRELDEDVPVVVQVTITDEVVTPEGIEPGDFARTIAEWDVDAIGVNCGVGPVATLEALEEIRQAVDLPLSAQPNAGQPRSVHGRNIYLSSPEYMGSYARRYVQAGARVVGGCCGTEPAHIKAIKEAVVAAIPSTEQLRRPALTPAEVAQASSEPVPLVNKSGLAAALVEGKFVLTAQAFPPRGKAIQAGLDHVGRCREAGISWISIPEAGGGTRIPPFTFGYFCQRELGVEPVVEFACRHRMLLRMQSELIGAHALGLRNLHMVTGPPLVSRGEVPDALADLEVDSIGLTNMVARLNLGLDVGGTALGGALSFVLGVKLDPFAIDPEHELRRFGYKVEAGAEFCTTPPILDVPAFVRFLEQLGESRLPVIATLSPPTSYRRAERLRRVVGPEGVPREVLERLKEAERQGRELAEGLTIARETAEALRPHVQGLQVEFPEGHEAAVLDLLQDLG